MSKELADVDQLPLSTIKGGVFVGLSHDGACLVCPIGVIDRAGANELADRMTLQASKLRRFSLSG